MHFWLRITPDEIINKTVKNVIIQFYMLLFYHQNLLNLFVGILFVTFVISLYISTDLSTILLKNLQFSQIHLLGFQPHSFLSFQ